MLCEKTIYEHPPDLSALDINPEINFVLYSTKPTLTEYRKDAENAVRSF